MNDQSEIVNPITNNNDYRIISEIDIQRLCRSYFSLLNIDITRYFRNVPNVYLCECNITGYRFFSPFNISGDDLFYLALQNYNWYYQQDKWEFKISRKIIQTGSLLEIGCGRGDFLYGIKGKKQLITKGIEYNLDAIGVCTSKNLDVDKIELRDLPVNNYDYVVSFQVLEHISDVSDFFNNSRRILKTNGKLIIGVPDTRSFVFYPFSDLYYTHGSLLLNMPPHHMGWWHKNSLKKAAEYFGFIQLETYNEPLFKFRRDLVINNIKNGLNGCSNEKKSSVLLSILKMNMFKGETMLSVFQKA